MPAVLVPTSSVTARRWERTAADVSGLGRQGPVRVRPLSSLERLALWMAGLGVGVGLAFPYCAVGLGLPPEQVMAAGFRTSCVVAGLGVGGLNVLWARRVVGRRLKQLSSGLREVASHVTEATVTGNWDRCTPERCHMPVASHDDLGEVAAAFNSLLTALADSRAIESKTARLNAVLRENLDVAELSRRVVGVFRDGAHADGTAIILRGANPAVAAADGLLIEEAGLDQAVIDRLSAGDAAAEEVVHAVLIDAAPVPHPAQQVIALPLSVAGRRLGVVLLAFADATSAPDLRVVAGFLAPTSVAVHNALTHQRAQYLASRDELTGALNRRAGLELLTAAWREHLVGDAALGLLVIDVDRFKAINDTLGHHAGDQALACVARVLQSRLRAGDALLRSGGEEFVVILPGADGRMTSQVAERLRAGVAAECLAVEGHPLTLTVSIGGASSPGVGVPSAEQLIVAADQAMYVAKGAGRNATRMADPAARRRPEISAAPDIPVRAR